MRQFLLLSVLTALTILSGCKQDAALTPPAATTPAAPASAAPTELAEVPASKPVLATGSKISVAGKATESPVDFNGDGKPDRYEVITTDRDNDGLGFVRELRFYTDDEDTPWYVSEKAILSTEHGGTMGDPLQGINHTEKGIIRIDHFGGSRDKWKYTHTYRWQKGDFKLIGATILTDTPCEKSGELDYNLSTGKARYTQETIDCTSDEINPKTSESQFEFFRLTSPPSMKTYDIGTTEITVPQADVSVYY